MYNFREYKYSNRHYICSYRSLVVTYTLASEVVFLKMPSRNQKKRSKQRAEYLQKREDILSQENKAKARARYKADPEKKKASVRDTYKADPEKKKASVRDTYKADPEKKKASVRDTYNANAVSNVLLKGSDIKRASRRTVLLKGSDIKRASRRTVLLKGGYTGAIQLPLRQLEGVVELPLPPKGML